MPSVTSDHTRNHAHAAVAEMGARAGADAGRRFQQRSHLAWRDCSASTPRAVRIEPAAASAVRAADRDVRDDAQGRQQVAVVLRAGRRLAGRCCRRPPPGAADDLGGPELLQLAEDLVAHCRAGRTSARRRSGSSQAGSGSGHSARWTLAGLPGRAGEEVPELLGRVRDDRGQQPGQDVVQPGQDELRGAAVGAVGRLGVEAVLEDVEVEARQLDRAELVDPLIDPVELEPLVGRRRRRGSPR